MIALAAALLGVAGCHPRPASSAGVSRAIPPPAVMPGYAEVAERYNANLAGLAHLHSRAKLRFVWTEEGKERTETAEGTLAVVPPTRMAMSLEKLGKTGAWAGCDAERYWYFDLEDQKTAYVGRHAYVGRPCARELPLPVRPQDLPMLLGVVPLPAPPTTGASTAAPPDRVGWHPEGFLIAAPPGGDTRFFLDPITLRPARIDLLDSAGRPRATARLARVVSLERDDAAAGPAVASLLEITLPDRQARATVQLTHPTDGREKIQDRWFDFDRMTRALKPEKVVELDAGCEEEVHHGEHGKE